MLNSQFTCLPQCKNTDRERSQHITQCLHQVGEKQRRQSQEKGERHGKMNDVQLDLGSNSKSSLTSCDTVGKLFFLRFDFLMVKIEVPAISSPSGEDLMRDVSVQRWSCCHSTTGARYEMSL